MKWAKTQQSHDANMMMMMMMMMKHTRGFLFLVRPVTSLAGRCI
jgi:hypothetical protein